MDFKNRLKELRKAKDLSQAALADKIGLSKSTIGMYETGDITPSVEVLNTIADYFNVDMNYLLGKEEQSRFFMNYDVYTVASVLSADKELFLLVEKASKDEDFKNRLLQIAKLMEKNL